MLSVTKRLCGLHAQLMSSAELTVWARVEGLGRQAVQQALWDHRTLIKTWAMRGTLHLLPADEVWLWHSALTTNRLYLRPALWKKHFGITMEELDQLTDTIAAALNGRVLTRKELAQEVARLSGSVRLGATLAQSSWGTLLKPAAFAGCLCFGPSIGQRVRFTRPSSWLATEPLPVGQRAAMAEVTRRFLATYGPASHEDLARWWNGGGVSTARQCIADLGDEVRPVDVAGAPAWILTAHASELRDFPVKRSARLLPAFDQYVVAASCHAEHLLPGDLRRRIYRPQGWISPVLLVNGRMWGVWSHRINSSRTEVIIEPFVETPTWVRRAAEQEAERLATFLGTNANVTWTS
ncbi:MAG: winged helix DNA-binding protein [Bryobacterales bacterium]|nr:winged helix DNA-binding protein [Bryobacterales bacterium]